MAFIAYKQDGPPALVAITGPRIEVTAPQVFRVMDVLFPHASDIRLISGLAQGVDTHGIHWATRRGAGVIAVGIDDSLDGSDPYTAPKRRNQRMVDLKPFLCVGFPGHGGTNDMMDRCLKAGVIVWEVAFTDQDGFEVWQWPSPSEPQARMIAAGSFKPRT
ncbi:hypothetical protein CcrC1_gp221c [Caulobacter phage C1]|nr:hypothetical protein CcrC1_gp221c [Caulobacter phage C1]UTU08450.1 hypothetical protein CcrC2_gp222c [Caulobacter phage C2]UTU08967.1 hypothetical protein CcrJ4_gp216c [Caulobacter phage J4]UTU10083.1 hypothetical protein CcrRB23_gp221c [Caulobacter phage RB23]WGN97118.1 hypothetical protein [Bertelyvirus sp.]